MALLAGIITAVTYILAIKGQTEANARNITTNEQTILHFREKYISHTRIVDENFSQLKEGQGELRGRIDILIELMKQQEKR